MWLRLKCERSGCCIPLLLLLQLPPCASAAPRDDCFSATHRPCYSYQLVSSLCLQLLQTWAASFRVFGAALALYRLSTRSSRGGAALATDALSAAEADAATRQHSYRAWLTYIQQAVAHHLLLILGCAAVMASFIIAAIFGLLAPDTLPAGVDGSAAYLCFLTGVVVCGTAFLVARSHTSAAQESTGTGAGAGSRPGSLQGSSSSVTTTASSSDAPWRRQNSAFDVAGAASAGDAASQPPAGATAFGAGSAQKRPAYVAGSGMDLAVCAFLCIAATLLTVRNVCVAALVTWAPPSVRAFYVFAAVEVLAQTVQHVSGLVTGGALYSQFFHRAGTAGDTKALRPSRYALFACGLLLLQTGCNASWFMLDFVPRSRVAHGVMAPFTESTWANRALGLASMLFRGLALLMTSVNCFRVLAAVGRVYIAGQLCLPATTTGSQGRGRRA